MSNEQQAAVVNEELWRAWKEKGRLRDQSTARRMKILAGVFLVLMAAASYYLLAVR